VNLGLRDSKPSEQVYKGIRDCVKTIYKQNGLKGLYRGMGMLFLNFTFDSRPRFISVAILTNFFVLQLHHYMESFLIPVLSSISMKR
jgi:hypothetical protein